MIDQIKSLCELLSSTPLTVQEVADSIGTTERGGQNNVPLTVKPSDRSIKEARIVSRDESDDEPAYVELTPVQSLSVSDLKAAFGAYRNVPSGTNPNQPPRVAFEVDDSEMPFTVTLFAAYEEGSQGAEDGHVMRLTLRRDAR